MLIHVQHRFSTSRESSLFYSGTFINSATPLVLRLGATPNLTIWRTNTFLIHTSISKENDDVEVDVIDSIEWIKLGDFYFTDFNMLVFVKNRGMNRENGSTPLCVTPPGKIGTCSEHWGSAAAADKQAGAQPSHVPVDTESRSLL